MSIKISELTPKGANLEATDLLEISESTADGYSSKSITGAEIITASQEGMQVGLVSGSNIKTINSTSLLGSGDLEVQPTLVSGTNIKTINGNTLLGSGDLTISGGGGLTIGTTAITSGTIGRILFEGTGNVVQESANLFWDNTNGRLGINTALPNMALDIRTGNVGIGVTSNSGFKLDVNGTARVSGAITLTDSSAGLVGSAQGVVIGSAYWTDFTYGGTRTHRLALNVYGLNSYFGNNIAFGYNPTGSSPASAKIEIGAGTATAGTAPLKLRAGTNLTTPENGAFEFDGTNLYFTVGGVRKTINLI